MGGKRSGIRILTAAALSAAFLFCPACTGQSCAAVTTPQTPADRGKSEAELNGVSEEKWAALNDNQLEYGEIEGLIQYFNPTVSNLWSQWNTGLSDMDHMLESLSSSRREMKTDGEQAKDAKDYSAYGTYVMQEKILDSVINGISRNRRNMTGTEAAKTAGIRAVQYQMVKVAQTLFVSYRSLLDQKAILTELRDMDQKLYNDAAARYAVGTGTETDVTAAQVALLSTQSKLSALDAAAESIRKNLIVMCGWKEDAMPEIGEAPACDPTRIDTMNPDADLTTAIGNNQEIIAFRHATHVKSTASHNAREISEEGMNRNVAANLKAYYDEVLADRTAYQAAQTGMQAAEISKNAADLQYRLGMLTPSAYAGALTSYIQGKSTLATADRTLFLAMETYDWAVKGLCPAE